MTHKISIYYEKYIDYPEATKISLNSAQEPFYLLPLLFISILLAYGSFVSALPFIGAFFVATGIIIIALLLTISERRNKNIEKAINEAKRIEKELDRLFPLAQNAEYFLKTASPEEFSRAANRNLMSVKQYKAYCKKNIRAYVSACHEYNRMHSKKISL